MVPTNIAAIVEGMLAGIGILILASQFHVMVDDTPKGSGIQNLLSIPEAIEKGAAWPRWESRDQRLLRTSLVQTFGSIQAAQVELEELVAETVPKTDKDDWEVFETDEREGFVERQEAINQQLKQLASKIQGAGLTDVDGKKSRRIIQAFQQATDATSLAIRDLNTSNVQNVRTSQSTAVNALEEVQQSLKNHEWAAKIGLLTITIIVLWNVFLARRIRFIPAPLVGVALATIVSTWLALPVLYVEVPTHLLDNLHLPSTVVQDVSWLTLFGFGLVIAAISSSESLLCANALRLMHHGRMRYDRELIAQGLGNCICGMLGALPIAGVIVRSATNVQMGAKTRLSACLHSLWILLAIFWFHPFLAMIPTASLAAILVYIGFRLVNIQAILDLRKVGTTEVMIYFATLLNIVMFDLLIGIVVGVILYEIKLLFRFFQLDVHLDLDNGKRQANLRLTGAATFLKSSKFTRSLRMIPRGYDIFFEMEHLRHMDQTCVTILERWAAEHEANGGKLAIDWDSVRLKSRLNFNDGK